MDYGDGKKNPLVDSIPGQSRQARRHIGSRPAMRKDVYSDGPVLPAPLPAGEDQPGQQRHRETGDYVRCRPRAAGLRQLGLGARLVPNNDATLERTGRRIHAEHVDPVVRFPGRTAGHAARIRDRKFLAGIQIYNTPHDPVLRSAGRAVLRQPGPIRPVPYDTAVNVPSGFRHARLELRDGKQPVAGRKPRPVVVEQIQHASHGADCLPELVGYDGLVPAIELRALVLLDDAVLVALALDLLGQEAPVDDLAGIFGLNVFL